MTLDQEQRLEDSPSFVVSATLLWLGGAILFCLALMISMGFPAARYELPVSLAVFWAVIALVLAIGTRRHPPKRLVGIGRIWLGVLVAAALASGLISITDLIF